MEKTQTFPLIRATYLLVTTRYTVIYFIMVVGFIQQTQCKEELDKRIILESPPMRKSQYSIRLCEANATNENGNSKQNTSMMPHEIEEKMRFS